jgi:hypothetical protein
VWWFDSVYWLSGFILKFSFIVLSHKG